MGSIVLALLDESSGEQLRGLRDWLGREAELRGRIQLVESGPVPGTLGGGIVRALSVAVATGTAQGAAGPGGMVTVLVSGIVSWLRQLAGHGRHPVPTEITLDLAGGGRIEIKAPMVRAWTQAELGEQVDRLAALVQAGLVQAGLESAHALAPASTTEGGTTEGGTTEAGSPAGDPAVTGTVPEGTVLAETVRADTVLDDAG